MKNMVLFVVVALLMISQLAHARLGDTKEQCDQRYGTPIASEKTNKYGLDCFTYSKQGFTIMILFYKSVATALSYTKPLGDKLDAFTNEDIEALKKANGDGKDWKYNEAMAKKVPGAYWNRSDYNAFCVYDVINKRLSFQDSDDAYRVQQIGTKGASTEGL